MPFYKYRTDLGNTVTAKSTTSFTGLTGNEAQISSTIDTPTIQSVNLYKVNAGILVDNDETTINNYYKSIGIVVQGYPTYNQFTGYTGTTAPATFALKVNFNTFTGTTAPGTYLTKSGFNIYSGTTEPTLYASKTKFNTFTGTTAPLTYQNKSSIVTLTGTTLPLTYQSKSSIVTLTGTTLPVTYQTKSSIVTLTGTTLPLTYQNKSSIVTLTGTTLPATYASKSVFNTYTGTTAPARYFPKSGGTVTGGLAVGGSGSYGGSLGVTGSITEGGVPLASKYLQLSDATLTYQSKSSINILTGSTLPLTYQSKSSIVTLTGTTLPLTYVAKSVFSTYTGGTTNVTSAGNGIRKNGNNVRLGGSLTGSTNIGLGTFNLVFTGTTGTLRYGSDLSASYNIRSLVDLGYVTANTNSTIIFKNNATQLNTPPVEFTTVNFSSGHTLINRGSGVLEVKVIYGSEVFTTGKTTTQTSTSATFADYCAKGFTVAGGTYRVEYCMKVGNNTTLGTNIGVQLLVDGTSIEAGTVNAYRISTSNTFVSISAFKIMTLTAGSHSFRAQFATAANTATADNCQIVVTRIS